MKRKVIAFLLVFLHIINIVNVCAQESSINQLSKDKNVAEAYLEKNAQSKGFSNIYFGKTDGDSYTKYNSKECWLLDTSQGENKAYIDFIFDSSFKKQECFDGSVYDIEIEYYNYLEGFFFLYYDSVYDDNKREQEVYLSNKKQWETVKFTLTDAEFNKGIEGKADLRISILGPTRKAGNAKVVSQNPVGIHHIRVTRREDKNPVLVSADVKNPGNSFTWFSEKKEIDTTLLNVKSNPVDVDITYRLVSDNGEIPFEKSERINFAENETKLISVNVGEVKECAIYTYEIDVKYPEGKVVETQKPTKIAILKTDPDGIRNNDVMYAASFDRYSQESVAEGVAILALSNSYGGRMDLTIGSMINKDTQEYDIEKTDTKNRIFLANEMLKYGMKATGLVWGLYDVPSMRNYREIPGGIGGKQGEEQLKEWERGLKFVAETFKGKVDYYEIWNEPNLKNFNYDLTTGDGHAYAKIAMKAVDVFAEMNPEATVFGPGITGIGQDKTKNGPGQIGGKEFFDQAMESGMWSKINNLSFHAYSWGSPDQTESETIKNMKQLQADYLKKGVEKPKLWVTEMGFSKATEFVGDYVKQGAYTCQQIICFKVNDVLDYPCTIYNLEKTAFPQNLKEATYGHVNMGDDNSPKYGTLYFPNISYLMVTGYNYVMANAEFEQSYDYEDGTVRINKFWSDKFNKNVVALHTTGKNEFVTMDLGTDHITYYDSLGNSKEIYAENGIYTFVATIEPNYIVGDISEVNVIENYGLNCFEKIEYMSAAHDLIQIPLINKSNKTYSVNIKSSKYVPQTEILPLKAGEKNIVKLVNSAPIGTDYTLDIDICDGDKTIQTARIKISTKSRVDAKLSFDILPGNSVNNWLATLHLTNLSATLALRGKISFRAPDFMEDYDNISIGMITPGRTGEVQFMVSDIVKKGVFGFEYDVISEDGIKYSFREKTNFTIAKYAKNKPKIDGIADKGEWFYDSAMNVDDDSQVQWLQDVAWRGIYDLSGKVVIEWDEENMYLFGEVTDDVFSNPSTPNKYWEGDGIQIGVVYADEGWTFFGEANTTFHEIGIGLFETGAAAYRTGSQDSSYENGLVEEAEIAIKRNEDKTIYEMRIPWKALLRDGEQPTSGDLLGFSYLINDNDGSGRRGWIEYTGGIGRNKNNRLFTSIKLID